MNKKLLIGFVVVFIVGSGLEAFEHNVLLKPIYDSVPGLRRTDEGSFLWIVIASYLVWAFFLTLIFSKGYEGKGMMEGVRFGLYVSLILSVPYHYLVYASQPIPHELAFLRASIGTVQNIIYGIILALVYGRQAMVIRVASRQQEAVLHQSPGT